MQQNAIQDQYPEDYTHCYGCGLNNEQGFQLKSYWDGEECVCHHTPKSFYTGGTPSILYGGIIASLIDCHAAATAAAAKAHAEKEPISRFVTASLTVDFFKPTPMGVELELRGKALEIKGRKVIVEIIMTAGEIPCAVGKVIMVQPKNAT
jgi:acyl-coenzyme A thioesterase PaaI-like protein